MDRLKAMSLFLAVAEQESFAAAARRLRMPAPTVTRAVAEIEARLGVTLLKRTTRQVRLTGAGARYASDCRRILAEVHEAEEAASGASAQPHGKLVVTAPALFGRLHVMPLVVRYLNQYPETQAQCLLVDRVVDLVDEGVDVAVRIGQLQDSTLQAIAVGKVRRVLCAAPMYLQRRGRPEQPADLAQHDLICLSDHGRRAEWRFRDGHKTRVMKLAPRLTTTTNDAAIAAAVAGFGITRALSYQIAEAVAQGGLEIILPHWEPPPLPVHVVHREGRQMARRVRAFIDTLVTGLEADLISVPSL